MICSNSVPMRWQHMIKAALLPAVLLLFAAGNAFGDVQYAITDLGTLGRTYSQANAINNSGQVVGLATTSTSDGFVLLSGDGFVHAFLYSGNGPMQDLGTFGGPSSRATAINDNGQVVGYATISFQGPIDNPDPFPKHAFLYSGSGPMQDLGTLGGSNGEASGINDSGQVVGYAITSNNYLHAFRTSPNSPINPATDDLGTLGGDRSEAYGINNSGQVVGRARTSDGTSHAFLYSGSGPMQDLGTLGGTLSSASAINSSGQVVGYNYLSGGNYRVFLSNSSGPMQDLNNLITPSSGWTLEKANAINDKGQIVGSGTNPAGENHAFLVSPLSTITTTTGAPPNTLSNALKPVDPTVTPPSGNLKRWNGSSWDNVTSWTGNGIDPNQPTVVIAHGWNGQISNSNWTASTAHILQLQDENSNILAWDWSAEAVSKPGQEAVPVWDDLVAQGLKGAEASAKRGGTQQGKLLANELQKLHVNNDNLQLVGHSNGGAVVGQAASELAIGGQKVQRITTLDAPDLLLGTIPQAAAAFKQWGWTSVDAMRYVDPNSASQVEVYYSNGLLGRTAFGFGGPLDDSSDSNIFNGRIYPGLPVLLPDDAENSDHSRIIDWYHEVPSGTPEDGEFVASLNWSILGSGANQWVAGNYTEQGFDSKVFGTSSLTQQAAQSLVERTVDTFETGTNWLGQHVEMFMRDVGNFAAKITSGSDGYLWQDVSVPGDAYYLTFDLKIETPDAGDFLTVTLGDELIFYKALNAADSDFWTVDPIFIGDFAGQTDTLLFTLNHVGTGTPSLLLDNITFLSVPEPSTFVLLCVCAISLLAYAWRRRKWAEG